MRVNVDSGKYTVVAEQGKGLRALRYGEEWRDLCGDNLVYCLAYELNEMREYVMKLRAAYEASQREDDPFAGSDGACELRKLFDTLEE